MGDGRPGTGGTAGTVASGARGTGRGGVSTRRGACAVPGGGKDEKLFAKDIVALSQLRLLEMLSNGQGEQWLVLLVAMVTARLCVDSAESSEGEFIFC